jgi:hypothetical protein
MRADVVTLADLFRRGDAAGLARELARCVPGEDRIAELVRFALSDATEPSAIAARSPLEAAFLAEIAAGHAPNRGPWHTRRIASEVFDPLSEDHGPDHRGAGAWGAAQWLNFLQLRQIAPRHRAAVVATVRDEALGLVEWIAHYRALGIERIFIYTNDNIDGTDALLDCLAGHGLVALIRNEVAPGPSPQRKAYAHALQFLPELRESEWAFFIDADEFFIPPAATAFTASGFADWLDAVDRRPAMKPPSAIMFDWRWHVSGNRYAYEPGLVLRRFPHIRPHGGFKSLVRVADTVSMQRLHFPDLVHGAILVDSDLREVPQDGAWQLPPASGAGGWINHYWTKSFEEFSIKKARGETHAEWARDFSLFFAWNGPETPETLAPPPEALVVRVASEHNRILRLPGVVEHVSRARRLLPSMLARFDAQGGLRSIYDRVRPA